MEIVVYPINKDTGLKFTEIDKISFIDKETHGAGSTFGFDEKFEGRALVVCSPNVSVVKIDDEDEEF